MVIISQQFKFESMFKLAGDIERYPILTFFKEISPYSSLPTKKGSDYYYSVLPDNPWQ
jgi:hypothetical protein